MIWWTLLRNLQTTTVTYEDPAVGTRSGFGGVILHGLAFYGIVARGLVLNLADGNPRRLKAIDARFSSPVKPGGK